MIRVWLLASLIFMLPCASLHAAEAAPENAGNTSKNLGTDSIGTATMKEDGTLVLSLLAEGDDDTDNAPLVYPPGHKEYPAILQHIGPIKPGETKPVMPWPEND